MIREFQVDTDQPLPELSELINRLFRDRRSATPSMMLSEQQKGECHQRVKGKLNS
jgi:hypothetical protein